MDDDAEVHPQKGRNRQARISRMPSEKLANQPDGDLDTASLPIGMESGRESRIQRPSEVASSLRSVDCHSKRGQFFLIARVVDSDRNDCRMSDPCQVLGANSPRTSERGSPTENRAKTLTYGIIENRVRGTMNRLGNIGRNDTNSVLQSIRPPA